MLKNRRSKQNKRVCALLENEKQQKCQVESIRDLKQYEKSKTYYLDIFSDSVTTSIWVYQ